VSTICPIYGGGRPETSTNRSTSPIRVYWAFVDGHGRQKTLHPPEVGGKIRQCDRVRVREEAVPGGRGRHQEYDLLLRGWRRTRCRWRSRRRSSASGRRRSTTSMRAFRCIEALGCAAVARVAARNEPISPFWWFRRARPSGLPISASSLKRRNRQAWSSALSTGPASPATPWQRRAMPAALRRQADDLCRGGGLGLQPKYERAKPTRHADLLQ
jgi:hypothetical protein